MFRMESNNATFHIAIIISSVFGIVLCICNFYWRHQFHVALRTIRSLEDNNRVLQKLALHDSLTGLPNRGLFEDRLQQAIDKATRARSRFAILFVDLDGFKMVNDIHGHDAGDLLLVAVAQRFRDSVREEDTVARLGGDEFIVLAQIVEPENAALVAEKLSAVTREPFTLARQSIHISASVGVATFPRDGTTIPALMKIADVAMYKEKHSMRDRPVCS